MPRRLIPVIHDFLLAVKDVFKERGLLIPPVILCEATERL